MIEWNLWYVVFNYKNKIKLSLKKKHLHSHQVILINILPGKTENVLKSNPNQK